MNDFETHAPIVELNNNNNNSNNTNGSAFKTDEIFLTKRDYNSSSTSSSDISEEVEIGALQEEILKEQDSKVQQDDPPVEDEQAAQKRARSMSDGATVEPEPFEVFPSLPDSVLEKMGLLNDNTRERLTDDELEQKFVSLSLAFTIDGATIKNRCDRQRRCRDQTELNFHNEIDRLIEKVNLLQPLCVDAEKTELLAALLTQVDIIIRASAHAAISAERFGAVQHEVRLSESVQLMINHVNVLKQQRDSARRQLQYTKRVLQDTNSNDTNNVRQRSSHLNGGGGGRSMTRRRASIASISNPNQDIATRTSPMDAKKLMTRRTSELSLRGNGFSRNARPARLELGLDLIKIREGLVIENHIPTILDEENEDFELCEEEEKPNEEEIDCTNQQPTEDDQLAVGLRNKLLNRTKKFGRFIDVTLKSWINDSNSNEVFYFCALMCFSLSLIMLGNILIELEYTKRGISVFDFWNFTFLSNEHSDTLIAT